MRLTKGMKKVLSLTLAAALVVPAVSIPGAESKAFTDADNIVYAWEGNVDFSTGVDGDERWTLEADANYSTTTSKGALGLLTRNAWNGNAKGEARISIDGVNLENAKFKKGDMTSPKLYVVAEPTEEADEDSYINVIKAWGTNDNGWKPTLVLDTPEDAEVDNDGYQLITKKTVLSGDLEGGELMVLHAPNCKVTQIIISDGELPEDYFAEEPVGGNSFTATLDFVYPSNERPECEGVTVDRDGSYELSVVNEEEADDLNMAWITTDLKNGSVGEDFSMKVTEIQIGNTEYAFANADPGLLCFADQNAYVTDAEGNKIPGTYRYNIRNRYNKLYDPADHATSIAGTHADIFGGQEIFIPENATVTVKFEVENLNSDAEKKTYEQIADKAATIEKEGYDADHQYGSTEATKTVATPDPASSADPSTQPSATTPSGSTPTPTATAPGAKTATATPAPGAKTATATPTAAPKTATAKVKCTKVKAAKKTYTIKKKGKTTKVVFKLTTSPKNKKTAEKVSFKFSKKKIAKVTKKKLAAKKLTVTVKGLKKGKTVLTAKVGSKSGKATIKVKK